MGMFILNVDRTVRDFPDDIDVYSGFLEEKLKKIAETFG